jgi:hypothetical protein
MDSHQHEERLGHRLLSRRPFIRSDTREAIPRGPPEGLEAIYVQLRWPSSAMRQELVERNLAERVLPPKQRNESGALDERGGRPVLGVCPPRKTIRCTRRTS